MALRPQTTATLVPLLYQDGPTDRKARFPGQVRPTLALSTTHSRIWPRLPSQSLQVEYYASHGFVTLIFLYFSYRTKTVLTYSPQMLPFQVFYFYEWLEQHNDPAESLSDRVQLLCIASISFLATRPRFWQTNDIGAKKTSRKRCREHPSTRVFPLCPNIRY